MKKLITILFIFFWFCGFSQNHNSFFGSYMGTSPTITQFGTTLVDWQNANYAIVYSTVQGNGNGSVITYFGMVYSLTNSEPLIGQSGTTNYTYPTSGGNSYIKNSPYMIQYILSNSGGPYYIRGWMANQYDTVYSTVVQMTIYPATYDIPSVQTAINNDIFSTEANIGGSVLSNGGLGLSSYGVCYSTSPNPTTSDSYIVGTGSSSAFIGYITGLSPNTTYYARAYAVNSQGTGYGNEISFTTELLYLPTITTESVTHISTNVVTATGQVFSDGGDSVTVRGFVYGTSPNPTTANGVENNGAGVGRYTSLVSGLTANTTYYLRSYATNSVGTIYGNEISFTTLPEIYLPSVSTIAPYNVTDTTVSSGGYVYYTGGGTISARGVVLGTSANPTTASYLKITSNGTGDGYFGSNISGLTGSTIYHLRAYCTNEAGTTYGSDYSFTTGNTVVLPTVSTTAITSITDNSASGGGNVLSDGGASVTARGICIAIKPNIPTTDSTKTINGSGTGSFSSSLTSLNYSTTYYVRAYATNSVGTAYGNIVEFTTLAPIVIPSVTTSTPTGIATNQAILGGNITNSGGGTVTERGIVYATHETPTISDTKNTNGTGTGAFSETITGLTSNTTYWVRAYGINSSGTGYGTSMPFTTDDNTTIPTVTTNYVTSVTYNGGVFGGNIVDYGGLILLEKGIQVSLNSDMTSFTTYECKGVFSYIVEDLSCMNTTYYYRAYAINAQGIGYGEIRTFTTTFSTPSYSAAFLTYYLCDGGSTVYITDLVSAGDAYYEYTTCAGSETKHFSNGFYKHNSAIISEGDILYTATYCGFPSGYYVIVEPTWYSLDGVWYGVIVQNGIVISKNAIIL